MRKKTEKLCRTLRLRLTHSVRERHKRIALTGRTTVTVPTGVTAYLDIAASTELAGTVTLRSPA